MGDSRVEVLVQAVAYLNGGEVDSAKRIIDEEYPFVPVERRGRRYTVRQMVENNKKTRRFSGLRHFLITAEEMFPDS